MLVLGINAVTEKFTITKSYKDLMYTNVKCK